MANKTTTLGLTKPLRTEDYNVEDFNNNADKLDEFAKTISTIIANIKEAINNHSHALNGTGIKGVLPISKGGTGATTASVAAKNLGVDNKADKNHTHTLDDISETNTKKIMTYNEKEKLGQLSKWAYVIAASDTDESIKKFANLKCTGKSDETTIRTFIDSIPTGSTIYLLAGTYRFNAPLVLFKPINLIGSGALTKLININAGYIISITSSFVTVQNMQLIRYTNEMEEKSNNSLIEFYSLNNISISDVTIKGCLLNFQNGEENAQSNVIAVNNPNKLENLTQIRILENTFVYVSEAAFNGFDIDLSNVPNAMSAVAGANISNRGIKIRKKKGKAVYLYGQDTTVEEVD